MNSDQVYVSFPLANGTSAAICADVSCSWLLDILEQTHNMHKKPSRRLLASIMPLDPLKKHEFFSESKRFQVDLPPDKTPQIFLGEIPETNEIKIKIARITMFLALLPLLKNQELFLFHGGLTVDDNGNGCILCGPSGVGKSTAVKKAGTIWEILSDDLIYISFIDGKCFAQPGPTWSSYLLDKERPVDCDISRIVEVKNTIILSRIGEIGISELKPMQAGLMIANSFIEMTGWMAGLMREKQLSAELRKKAFDAVALMQKSTNCVQLTSALETDLTPYLRSLL